MVAFPRPGTDACLGEINRGAKFAAARSIRTDEVGVAKPAHSRGTIGFPTRPKVATRKSAEYRWTASVRALALQGVEDLFDRVHVASGEGASIGRQVRSLIAFSANRRPRRKCVKRVVRPRVKAATNFAAARPALAKLELSAVCSLMSSIPVLLAPGGVELHDFEACNEARPKCLCRSHVNAVGSGLAG